MRPAQFQVPLTPVAPQADLDLDIRVLRTWLAVDDDGDPVLVIKDDDAAVIVDFGLGGSWDKAIQAAEDLGETAHAYASKLRDTRADRERRA